MKRKPISVLGVIALVLAICATKTADIQQADI